mgnify:CR=1 FL=1
MIDKIRKQGAEDIVKAVIKEHNMHELSDKYAVAVTTPFGQLRALEIGLIRSKVDNLLNKGE